MWNLRNKINKQTKLKQTQTQRANWWLPERRGVGKWVKEVTGLGSTNWWSLNSHGDVSKA